MRICMLAYTFYENDNRVMRYAETLANRGDMVDVISLRKPGQAIRSKKNDVNLFRIQTRSYKEKKEKIYYLVRVLKFLIKSSLLLSLKHLRKPYNLIHVHSVPDFEVFAAWLPKLTGCRIILDIHDIVPEFYISKFNTHKKSIVFKLLVFFEKLSTGFSNHVIIANHLWYDTLLSRSIKKDKCTVIMNYPDKDIFYKRPKRIKDGMFIILYPGTINHHQGVDIAVRSIDQIKERIPSVELQIFGDGPSRDEIKQLIRELQLGNRVKLNGMLPIEKIAEVMAESDLGIVPKRKESFGNEAFSTKTLEFMSLGIPVVISDTKIDKYYFDDSLVSFFKSGDVDDLSKNILNIYKDGKKREENVRNALKYIENNNWFVKKTIYLDLLDSLVSNRIISNC